MRRDLKVDELKKNVTSDTIGEFVPEAGALKRDRFLSVVFGC